LGVKTQAAGGNKPGPENSKITGDVIVHVEHSDYTGRSVVELRDITEPLKVRDLLNEHTHHERFAYQQRQQTRYFGR
jgi:hypothetical protein